MESKPKKPMEQMLEALAKARRAQFGDEPKMPNPMRARLHDEIAQAGMTEDDKVESRPSWITMFWPRVTVAAALATLLVLVPAIWWNQSHPSAGRDDLALRDRTAEFNAAVPAKDTAANASAVSGTDATVNLADNSQVKIEPGAAAPSSESEEVKPPTSLAQGRGVTELRSRQKKEFDTKIASAKVQAASAAAPPAGANSKAESDGMAAAAPLAPQQSSVGSLTTTEQFSQQSGAQSFRNNAQVSGAANVMNKFQVQQQGDEIRVLDADGSTYAGKIEQATKSGELDSRIAARRDLAKQKLGYAARSVDENKPASLQLYFRATGYNLSLKKTLVFEGNYEAPPPQQRTAAGSNDREQAEQSRHQARIVGTVRVNGEAAVQVDAIAFTPEATETKKNEK